MTPKTDFLIVFATVTIVAISGLFLAGIMWGW